MNNKIDKIEKEEEKLVDKSELNLLKSKLKATYGEKLDDRSNQG